MASTRAEVGSPTGMSTTRFSTEPSSPTSTTRALVGSRRTNSICLRRGSRLAVTTTPAPRDRPDSRVEASVRTPSRVRPSRRGPARRWWRGRPRTDRRTPAWHRRRNAGRARSAGGPALVCGAWIRPSTSRSCMTLRTEAGDERARQQARDVARADRLAGRQIGLDDLAEDLARALVELRQLVGRAGRRHDRQG